MVTQRLQLGNSPYKGVWDCVKQVFREDGIGAFYASYRTTVLMNAPFTATHFATYEAVKKGLMEISPEHADEERLIVHATAGAAAGGLASVITTPLDVVKTQLQCQAMERRRACLGEVNGETAEGQVPSPQFQDAPPEREVTTATPSTIKRRLCPPPSVLKVHKILLEVANQPNEGEFVTPQKKLLNSIDKVEKVVLEELQRLKRTPSAKKAERERKVRTLMSMR